MGVGILSKLPILFSVDAGMVVWVIRLIKFKLLNNVDSIFVVTKLGMPSKIAFNN